MADWNFGPAAFRRIVVSGLWALLAASAAQAQAVRVEAVFYEGRQVEAARVNVTLPRQKDADAPKPQPQMLKAGVQLAAGTELSTPALTRVLFRTGANTVHLDASSRLVIQQAGPKGDVFSLNLGKAFFDIVKVTNVHNVQHKDFNAHVKGTKYLMEVVPGQAVRYQVQEGGVRVEHETTVRIGEAFKDIPGVRVSETINAGQKKEYRLSAGEYFQKFNTYVDAEAHFRRQLADDVASRDPERILDGLYNLGTILTGIGKPKDALAVLGEGLKRATADDDDEGRFDFLLALGDAHAALSASEEALEQHMAAMDVLVEGEDPHLESEEAVDVMIAVGNDLFDLGEYAKALQSFSDAADVLEEIVGDEPDAQLAQLYVKVGTVMRKMGLKDEMREAYDEAIKMLGKLQLRPNDPLVGEVLMQFGEARAEMNDHAGAMKDFNDALRVYRSLYGDRHPHIAAAMRHVGLVQAALGQTREAVASVNNALAMNLQFFRDGQHAEVAACYSQLGNLAWVMTGDTGKGIALHQSALAILGRLYPDGVHPAIATEYSWMGFMARKAGDTRLAADYQKRYTAVTSRLNKREAADLARLEAEMR